MERLCPWIGDGVMSVRDVVQAAAGVGGAGEYIEDVFSTYLYTGTGATQTITNGIDLDGEGGLVWMKSRSLVGSNNSLVNTADGVNSGLVSNSASAATATDFSSFNANGFTLGSDVQGGYNNSGATFVSWTFRKAPKFFDVVTYTGTGLNTTIAHSLGAVPGMILVKKTSAGGVAWAVYHRSLANTEYLVLNTTAASATGATRWNNTTPTSSVFSLGTDASVNASGSTYVAYVFAHDAGGFGDDAQQNVISCGSYTGTGVVGNEVTLGFEPQWLLVKSSSLSENWWLVDVMRGMPVEDYTGAKGLRPNTNSAEATPFGLYPTATGFVLADGGGAINENNATYIYMAIRRPMKTPEAGTEVFMPFAASDSTRQTTGFPTDMFLDARRSGHSLNTLVGTRLGGPTVHLVTSSSGAETTGAGNIGDAYQYNDSFRPGIGFNWWCAFKRAPGFMDVVCYTGDGSIQNVTHNLGVTPEMIWVKRRSGTGGWMVYVNAVPSINLSLDNAAFFSSSKRISTASDSTFTVVNSTESNLSGDNYIAYLFATIPGVSKIGTYAGDSTARTIDCGFSSGARFVLIKDRTDGEDWAVFDTQRGIVAGDDPKLALNNTSAEVYADYLDPQSSGFIVNGGAGLHNVSGRNYIFWAIA